MALVTAVTITWLLAQPSQQAFSGNQFSSAPRWEYRYFVVPLPLEAQAGQTIAADKALERAGAEGWEYAGWSHNIPSTAHSGPMAYIAFKKQR